MIPPAAAELAALAAATLVSEDLTCITAGLLVRGGALDPIIAISGCFAGIFLGDIGLWAAGRLLGRRLLSWPWMARRLPPRRVREIGFRLDGNLARLVLASRLLPGARLPIYLAAGMLGRRGGWFALWAFVAAALWTPVLVLVSASAGPVFATSFERIAGLGGGAGAALAAGALLLFYRWAALAASRAGRARLAAQVSRIWRWEFWPVWLFYLPLAGWVGLLSIRHRGFGAITAANPGIPDGGFVGESKHQILSALPPGRVAPWRLIERGAPAARVEALQAAIDEGGWEFPIILKPDAGQRGVGVRMARDIREARDYLSQYDAPVIVQRFHPGPFEAGILYYRIPGEPSGRIFSITDKVFPAVVGDGSSTLEDLIWGHPRHRMQAQVFLGRHETWRGWIPAAGERVPLGLAGNHAQGAMFRDGRHLITPELERAVDEIARTFDGFYFGRFDVRYADTDEFMAGRDMAIVELNGVTSESTNIYDPGRSLLWAYGTLFRQWALLFRIGSINRAGGCRATPLGLLMARTAAYYARRPAWSAAD